MKSASSRRFSLAASPPVFALARYAILDMIFTAFLFGGVSLLAVAALKDRPALQWPGYLLIACSVVTKGPLAFVLCGLTFGLAILASADLRRRLLALRFIWGLLLVVALSLPWFVYMWLRFRDAFIAAYLFDENVSLFASNRFGTKFDPLFYFRVLAAGLLPWTGLVIGRLWDDVRAYRARSLDSTTDAALVLDARDRRLLHGVALQARSLRLSRRAGAVRDLRARVGRHPHARRDAAECGRAARRADHRPDPRARRHGRRLLHDRQARLAERGDPRAGRDARRRHRRHRPRDVRNTRACPRSPG